MSFRDEWSHTSEEDETHHVRAVTAAGLAFSALCKADSWYRTWPRTSSAARPSSQRLMARRAVNRSGRAHAPEVQVRPYNYSKNVPDRTMGPQGAC